MTQTIMTLLPFPRPPPCLNLLGNGGQLPFLPLYDATVVRGGKGEDGGSSQVFSSSYKMKNDKKAMSSFRVKSREKVHKFSPLNKPRCINAFKILTKRIKNTRDFHPYG